MRHKNSSPSARSRKPSDLGYADRVGFGIISDLAVDLQPGCNYVSVYGSRLATVRSEMGSMAITLDRLTMFSTRIVTNVKITLGDTDTFGASLPYISATQSREKVEGSEDEYHDLSYSASNRPEANTLSLYEIVKTMWMVHKLQIAEPAQYIE